MEFNKFKKAIQDHFAKLSETADHVYEVEVDKDKMWKISSPGWASLLRSGTACWSR